MKARASSLKSRIAALLVVAGLVWDAQYAAAEPVASNAPAKAPKAETAFPLTGFATVPAYGINTTTGGGAAPVIAVRTAKELQAAVERTGINKKDPRQNLPRVVRIDADIDLGELANQKPGNELTSVGVVKVASDTTIYSLGAGATIRHGTIEVHGAHNVIIRNLKFRDLWELDPTGKYDRFGWDYIRIVNSGKTHSDHVWIDHCDFEKAYDGMVDITHGSDLITVSWCRFAGDERGPQKKVSLVGHSSSENAAVMDRGHLNVTFHHNLFQNIDDRAPRVRFGNVHAFNNFIDGAKNASISVTGAVTLVDHCFYQDCQIATTFSHAADAEAKDKGGTIVMVNSRQVDPRPPATAATEREQFEIDHNFKSNADPAVFQFNPPAEWPWENRHVLPYAHRSDSVDEVPMIVRRDAGTGKVPDAELIKTGR
ncbi:MAG: hypothetical protein QOE70_5958 [Chthoniobacter sp.]|jgi:pectate lyase|nr:hypothetical protein [Chthoniobacter sp.]